MSNKTNKAIPTWGEVTSLYKTNITSHYNSTLETLIDELYTEYDNEMSHDMASICGTVTYEGDIGLNGSVFVEASIVIPLMVAEYGPKSYNFSATVLDIEHDWVLIT